MRRPELWNPEENRRPVVADVDFGGQINHPVLYLSAWDEKLADNEGTLHVCGELCAQRLQSQFMGNLRES